MGGKMCDREYYLPLRVKPSGECYCHRTCKSLYSVEDESCTNSDRIYFCTFCDHARIEVSPDGELMRHEYCRQHTTARA